MFERQSKIVSLDTINELCKYSKQKRSKPIVKKCLVKQTPKKEVVTLQKEEKSEEIILWL